ncbi:MAG: ATP-binding cassette domain-containing protein [Erysipelotrichales bacterium]|nr:ATP-binding cassette domain-containing protein [Erysipelotrichales bacterium]
MENSAIKIVNLTKKYKSVIAVDDLSLEIKKGELFGLLGVNGAGKSTTIKILSGLVKPDSGNAFILDKSIIKEPNVVKSFIAVSLQETSIARNLTVKENLDFYASIFNIKGEEKKRKIDEIVSQFNLNEVLNKRAKHLSGGWQRKLSIALSLVSSPKVLFLDEPTLGLDVLARRELWKTIKELKNKMTIILTTHYMEEAEALCDNIAIMVNGKIKDIGTSNELIEKTEAKNFEDAFVKIAIGGNE